MRYEFTIEPEWLRRFAEISGDWNSAHMDEEFARKTRYRERVAHGMLSFSFLACLQNSFPMQTLRFREMEGRFLKPVFPGDKLTLDLQVPELDSPTEQRKCLAVWKKSATGEVVLKAAATFVLMAQTPSVPKVEKDGGSMVASRLEEAVWSLDELESRREHVDFKHDHSVLSGYIQVVLANNGMWNAPALCPNLTASLMLSTLVGMRLPGRYATFSSFKIAFLSDVESGKLLRLSGVVEKILRSSESLEISVDLVSDSGEILAQGHVKALVGPVARRMPTCREIKDRFVDLGLRGKVALITGSSRGIGETTAKLFAMHGARVVVHYFRGKKDANAVVEDIRENGGTAVALGCDIRDEAAVRNLVHGILDVYGEIDILVNNAVREFQPKNLLDLEWNDYLKELEVSLKGMHNCCRETIPHFKKRRSGKIINLSSLVVDHPVTGQNQYITAKSAVVGYTRSLATELLKHNIQVNLVAPNMAETDLLSAIPAEFVKRIGQERVYGRNLSPIEVALSILYLASPWTDGITGQKIVLNLGEPPFA